MQNTIQITKPNTHEKIIITILLLLSIQDVIQYYVLEKIIPQLFLYINYFLALSLPLILLIKSRPKLNNYRVLYIFIYLIIFIISFLYLYNDIGLVLFSFVIYFHLISAFFFNSFTITNWQNTFKILAIIAITSTIFLLLNESLDLNIVIRRAYSWTKLFYYAVLYWAVIPFVLLSFLTKKNILLSLTYWGFAIFINLLFLKRSILVDSALLIVAIILMNPNKKFKTILGLVLVFSILVGLAIYFGGDMLAIILNTTSNRIYETSDDISSFDRLIETKNYLNNIDFYEFIFGKGFASSQDGYNGVHFALHIGWANFFFKGGMFFLMLVLIPYLKLISLSRKIRNLPLKVQFSFWFLAIYFFELMYSNMYNLTPEMILFFYSVFIIMDYNSKKQKIPA